jgi:hypothetical protein
MTGVKESRFQIVRFEVWHLFEYLLGAQAGGEQVEHVNHADSHAAYAWASAALLRVNGDSFKKVSH